MRLKRFQLDRYCCFDRLDLQLEPARGRINLVVAPNGAGKSVLRHAFHDLLFDIPQQSPMKFRDGYAGMALRAEAIGDDGVPFDFGWVRGAKPARVTSDDVRFSALRANITPRQLEQLFALDTNRLRQGGTDLKGGETLAGALLSGTGEFGRPRKLRAELEQRRQASWGKNKSKPPLNEALAKLTDARKRARAAVQRPQHREQQARELEMQRAALTDARTAHAQVRAQIERLHRIEITRPLLAALADAEAWLDAHPDAPALPAALVDTLAEVRAAIALAVSEHTLAEAAVEEALGEQARIARDPAAEALADRLAVLPEQMGEAERAAKDIGPVRAERVAGRAQIEATLREIGAVTGQRDVTPPVALLAAARSCISDHVKTKAAQDSADGALLEAAGRLQDAEREPDAVPPLPDGMVALLAEIHADRKPTLHEAESRASLHEATARLAAALAKVPGWSAGAEALRAAAVPPDAVLERQHAAYAKAIDAARQAGDALMAGRRRQNQLRCDLAAMQERPLPDDAAIAARRARRDDGWRLVALRAFSDQPDEAAELVFCGGEALPYAYERAVREADALADQRIAELDRVSAADRLRSELDQWAAASPAVEAELQRLEQEADAAGLLWQHAVAPLGLTADDGLPALRQCVQARLGVVDALQSVEQSRAQLADVQAAHAAWAERLAGMLDVKEPPLAPFAALIASAQARAEAFDKAASRRLVWETTHREAQAAHRRAQDQHRVARAASAEAETAWSAMLVRLGRPEGEPPGATEAVLERSVRLEGEMRAEATLGGRIDGMQRVIDGFAATVRALDTELGGGPSEEPFAGARALIARRDDAALRRSAWSQAARTLENARARLDAALDALLLAEQARDALLAQTAASDLDEAATLIAASRDHAHHSALRAQATAGLMMHGGGISRAILREDADAMPAEAIGAARAEADTREREAGATVEALAIAADRMQTEFDAGNDTGAVLDTAAEHEAAKAKFARLLDEHLVLEMASLMLSRAMAEVESQAADGGVGRLSALFATLTDDAYTLALDEEDGTTLHAVEQRHRERKKLDQLSEGTRDQLYLALRLAALSDHAEAGTVLPFIADDILQTFDDTRAVSALRALLRLSEVTQVIILTHHAHVGVLARSLGDAVHRVALAEP